MASSGAAPAAEAAAAQPTEMTPLVSRQRLSVAAVLVGNISPEAQQPSSDVEQGERSRGKGNDEQFVGDSESDDFVHIPAADAEGDTHAIVAGADGGRRQSSIFRADVEEHIRRADPSMLAWLTSPDGVAFQAGLCITLIAISAYEAVLKSRAIKQDGEDGKKTDFMAASLTTNASVISVFVALAIAAARGETHMIFDRNVFWSRMLRYCLPGSGAWVHRRRRLQGFGADTAADHRPLQFAVFRSQAVHRRLERTRGDHARCHRLLRDQGPRGGWQQAGRPE